MKKYPRSELTLPLPATKLNAQNIRYELPDRLNRNKYGKTSKKSKKNSNVTGAKSDQKIIKLQKVQRDKIKLEPACENIGLNSVQNEVNKHGLNVTIYGRNSNDEDRKSTTSESLIQDYVMTSLKEKEFTSSPAMQTDVMQANVMTSLLRGRVVTLGQGSDNKAYLILQQTLPVNNDSNNAATVANDNNSSTVQVVTLKRSDSSQLLKADVEGDTATNTEKNITVSNKGRIHYGL